MKLVGGSDTNCSQSTQKLEKRLEELEIEGRTVIAQITALLRSARIPRALEKSVIPIVYCVLGTVLKGLENRLEEKSKPFQITALLDQQEYWEGF